MFKLPVQPRAIENALFNVMARGLFNSPIWVILSTVDYNNLSHSITCRAEFPEAAETLLRCPVDQAEILDIYSDETQRT